MIQYTTPTFSFRFKDVQLAPGTQVWMTFQPWNKKNKVPTGEESTTFDDCTFVVEGNDTIVSLKLTQEQSAAFPLGCVRVMANYMTPDADRDASNKIFVDIVENLLPEVKQNV
jgi:hypothetical protein